MALGEQNTHTPATAENAVLSAQQDQLPQGRSPHDRLIEAARALFCRHGVNAVGVDAIIAAAGTAKTSLYRLFGSKEGLVEKVLEHEGRLWRAWFIAQLDNPGGDAMARLNRIGPALRAWFAQEDFYGCLFINAVGEGDKADDRLRKLAIAHKTIVLDRLTQICADAGYTEPAHVAHTLGLIMDGAIVTALITRNPTAADTAAEACAAVLTCQVKLTPAA